MKTKVIVIISILVCLCVFYIYKQSYFLFFNSNLKFGYVVKPAFLKYTLYQPTDKGNKPLLIILHGRNESGFDFLKPIRFITFKRIEEISKKYDCYVLIPQCNSGSLWFRKNQNGYNNWNTDSLTDIDNVKSLELVIKEITLKYNIDTSRLYSIGYSMGGGASLILTVRNPDLFAAIAPISCSVDDKNVLSYLNTSMFFIIGDKDEYFSVNQIDSLVDKLKENYNKKDVNFKIYSGKNHSIFKFVINNDSVLNQLFAVKKKYF